MAEGLRDSSSSLQRKKPPWLKLDIPVAPLLATAEEPASLQPLKHQAFFRSVSMPAENSLFPAAYSEARRPILQRQTSITQTIRRKAKVGRRQGSGPPERGCPSIKGACNPEDERLERSTSSTRQLRSPSPPVAPVSVGDLSRETWLPAPPRVPGIVCAPRLVTSWKSQF